MSLDRRALWLLRRSAILAMLFAHGQVALAHRIVACEPEWAALAEELGGTMVVVSSATTGLQDPHRIEARPSLIAKVRNADLLICTGVGVEEAWLPILLRESGNARVQPGQPGHLIAGDYVEKLDIPTVLDRALGDVHAQGNHHIQGDPRNMLLVADELARRLARIDPAHRSYFEARHQSFAERWRAAIRGWEIEAAPLKGVRIVEHHKAWTYLCRWLGMREVATLEPKPGLQPTIAHLRALLKILQREHPKFIVRASYNAPRASEWLAAQSGIPIAVLPSTVGGTNDAEDLFALYQATIQRLLNAAK
jgi:zinc/manganese transport system substrate-binding protein